MTAVDNLALTNYGHFTTMRVQDGAVRGLSLHLDRLVTDCATVFGAELSPGYVRGRIRAAIAGAEAPLTVRVTVADPGLRIGRPAAPADPQVLVTTRAATPQWQPPMRVRSTTYIRDVPAVKHTGLFGPLFERRRAQLDGYDDALFTDGDGRVGEGPTWNVGFVDGDTVVWPLADVLAGVTVRLLAAAHDGPQRTEPVELSRLSGMATAFATNAAGGIRPIAAVDGVTFATGHPIIGLLCRRYAEVVPEAV
ncbi:aminotransferase class IV [Micromonospora rubida]|uniref:aminotransferase class IV n=1 Tax=Micromonospora rubida TaxID=2697657 RepID=UPI001376EE30|nr:aminotransferase class IV [Micromonospora rubida]NBE83981.1 aminotransferase [Micromonospora rubida]